MKIKHYDRQGVVAWSNSKAHSQLLASASFQEDDGLYHLDILSLDLQQRSKSLNVIGNGYSDSAFRCVAWDNFGEKDAFSHGLIFTGMENSSFKLWNPAQMVATYNNRPAPSIEGLEWQEQEGIVIYEEELENSFPVMCGEWNSLNNHMLAFGTTDVFILLADQDPTNPDLRKPGKKNPHTGSYVTSVSWNREVGHILASASENGLVALWDVKSNNSIFHFGGDTGGSGNRNVVICWSKSISTQIAVTLDDQKSNKLQIWDLRNQKGPVIVIDKCHSKGINAMDWCETDPELILTASRDRKVVCWNYSQEEDEPLSQAVLESQPLSVKWSRKLPSIYSVSTESGTEVYSLSDANLYSYVPKWYKVPVGGNFLGSQAVNVYAQNRGAVLEENPLSDYGKNSPLRPQLKTLSKITEQRLEEDEGELARLIRAKISDGDTEIYEYLGFSKSKIVEQAEKYTGKKREFATGQQQKEKNTKQKPKAYTQIQGQDALAFFANIKAQEQPQTRSQQEQGAETYDMVPRNFNWDQGKERLVKQNILIGNYDGAIDAALKCGRTAEALIIAFSVGQTLFNNTLKTFFTETTDNFITDVLKHIAYKDPEELVKRYDLKKWKECIALIYTLSSKDKRAALLGQLAHRLRTESPENQAQLQQIPIPEDHPAVICHVLAEDFAKITQIYFDNLRSLESSNLQRKQTIIEYARRLLMIYSNLTTDVEVKLFQNIVREVAFIAIEQRQNALAHHLLSSYANGHVMRSLDYLVEVTPALETYKTAIKHRLIAFPAMQKKAEKKQAQQPVQQKSAPENKQKPKAKIFDREEEAVRPPPAPPAKRKEEQQEGGFSPYENTKPVEAPPKKNLNTPPPPPPVVHKKPVHHQEEQPQRDTPPPPPPKMQPVQPVPAPKKNNPPPPPPPPVHHQQEEEPVHKPPIKPVPVASQKKTPPPPPVHKQPPPPPPVYRQESNTEVEQEQPKTRPPPPPSKTTPPPPPPRASEPEVKEEPRRQPPPSIKPPPKMEEKAKQNFPPAKQEPTREQAYEQSPEPVKRTPPPPPAKRNAPPPPPRK